MSIAGSVAGILALGAVSAQPSTPARTASLAVVSPSRAAVEVESAGAVDTAAVRASIEDANAVWLDAFARGDQKALAGFYAADASLTGPRSASLEGSDRIAQHFAAQRRLGIDHASLQTLDVVCVDDVAYEVGRYGLGAVGSAPVDLAVTTDSGRYFAIWKAQPDGTWRYQVGIWTSDSDAIP